MKLAPAGLAIVALAAAAAAGAFVYLGAYNIAADEPHWPATERLLAAVRTRSIEVRARSLAVPANLADEKRVLAGAGQYAEMCVSCHLAPGVEDTPLRQGLYPKPPLLAKHGMDPRASFWIVKHGIKMTGMPAWGASHDDDTLWSIVAFLRRLPELDAARYRELVKRAPADEDMKPKKGRRAVPESGAHVRRGPLREPYGREEAGLRREGDAVVSPQRRTLLRAVIGVRIILTGAIVVRPSHAAGPAGAPADASGRQGAAPKAGVYRGSGTVTRLAPELAAVMIDHDPVEGLQWPAMNMTFGLRDHAFLDGLEEGERVEFLFVRSGGGYVITAITALR